MERENTKKEKRICKILLLLFTLVLLSLVPFFRYGEFDGWPQGKESYYHMRIAEEIFEEGIPEKESGSILPLPYSIDPFHFILGFFGKRIGIKNTAILLPVLLGIISIFLVYDALSRVSKNIKQNLLIAIFLCASPVFLTVFSQATDLPWISFLMAAGMWCFLQEGKMQWLSMLIFPFLFFYDLFHVIIAMLLLGYFVYERKKRKKLYVLWSVLSLGLVWILWTKNVIFPIKIHDFLEIIQLLLADVGAPLGISLFAIILGGIGIQHLLQEKKIMWKENGLLLLFLGLTLFRSQEYVIYLNGAITILAALGFIYLTKKEWKFQDLRKMTLFLLILGIVYSGTATVTRLATSFPDGQTMEALQWLEERSNENAILLTAPEYGFVVEQATKRKVLLDEKGLETEEGQRIANQIDAIFHAKLKETAEKLLQRYQVDYIIIFEEMKQGKVWTKEEGLIFVLEYGENFKKVFENDQVHIWRISYDEEG